jgi:hypothetical protein
VQGLDAEAEQARERALTHMQRLRRAADRFEERRADSEARATVTA